MQNSFHASGFVYHSPTQQILLQQFENGDSVKLTLFGNKSQKGTDPKIVFQRMMEDTLGIPIPLEAIYPIYDYTNDNLGEHFIFFVEVTDITPKAYPSKNKTDWYSLSKLSKYAMSEQTRHDIIVGERVIRSLLEATQPTQVRRH